MKLVLPTPPDTPGLRSFGVVTGIGFSLLIGLLIPWLLGFQLPVWPHIIGATFIGCGLMLPRVLKPVYRVWMGGAKALGFVNSQILLTLIFFLVVTPIGLLRRAVSRDTLGRRFSKKDASYRRASEHRNANHVEKPF